MSAATCPFCWGSTEVVGLQSIDDDGRTGPERHAVECQDCGAIGPQLDTPDDARASWDAVAEAAAAGRSVDASRQARIHARRLAGFDLPDVMTIQQAADWLGVHPSTIRRAAADRDLFVPHHEIANRPYLIDGEAG